MRFVPVRAAILGALFAAIITLPGLGNGTLWDNSETVYGEVAREVLVMHDWVVMHLNGAEWFIQPPLFFWIAALCAKVLGVTAFAMRLPAALATIAMGGALGYATARVAGTRAGTVAAIALSTSLMQAIVGRLAIMDALLDLCVVIAILCWFRALQPHDHPDDARRRTTAFLCGTLALAYGMLVKGPVAPVIVVLVIGVWLVWERRSGAPIAAPSPLTLLGACALFAVIAAPWFVLEALRVGPVAAGELIGHYTIGRYTGVIENQRGPWWYYVPVVILGFFPWIAFVPVAAGSALSEARTRAGSLDRLALVWVIAPLVFFSFAQTKLPNYVALILPALAIVVALWFERVADAVDRRAAIVSASTIPLFIGALGVAIVIFIRNNHFESATAIVGPEVEILGALMLAGSLATVAAVATRNWNWLAPYVLGATSGALVLFIAFVAEPAAEALKPIPPLAAIIQAQRSPGSVVGVRGVAGTYALIFYTAPGVVTLEEDNSDFRASICALPDLFLVTRLADVPQLTQLVAAQGRRSTTIGRERGVAVLRIGGPRCAEGSRRRARRSTNHSVMLQFTDERGASVELTPQAFTIAGYTGRDRAMVQKHIDELEREGIAPPPEVPMWYEMPVANLTTAETIAVTSPQSCGEVEPILIGYDGRLFLGIGSDHTARDVEREDIATSKRACPKPLGRSIVRISELDESYDALKLESWIDGEAYQSGTVAQLVPLTLLLAAFRKRTAASPFVLSCGTVPLLTHGFRFGKKFSAKISGGPLAVPLTLDYTTTVQGSK